MKKSIILCLVFVLILSMVACGKKVDGPETALKAFMDNMKEGQFKEAAKETYGGWGNDLEQDEQISTAKHIFKHLKYNVISTDVKGEEATIVVDITNKNLNEVMNSVITQAIGMMAEGGEDVKPEEIMHDLFVVAVDEAEDVTTNTEILMAKEDSKWKIKQTPELMRSLSGMSLDGMEEEVIEESELELEPEEAAEEEAEKTE